MRHLKFLIIASALAGSMAVAPAWAELRNTYTSMTGPQLAATLRAKGYQADLGADAAGDPLISSGTGGNHFQIWFSFCDKAPVRSCRMMVFKSIFINDMNYAPADANRCNSKYLFGKLTIEPDNIALTYGIPSANISDDYINAALDEWATLLSLYQSCMLEQRK